jgi:hypothetical protein
MRKTLLGLIALAAGAFAGFVALTSLTTGSSVATWAPCPRNWAWLPAWLPRASPLDELRFRVGDVRGKVCYGRPALRGRRMLGSAAVPFGRLWRTGANEPTTLHLDAPARLGPIALVPGSYALYTVPGATHWQVAVNRSIRQWGLESEYTAAVRARELGRFEVPVETLPAPVEVFTIRSVPAALSTVELLVEWERSRVRLPLVAGLGDELPDPDDVSPAGP